MTENGSDKLFTSPDIWQWSAIGNISEIITGRTPSKKEPKYYGNFIPFVKPPELTDGTITSAVDNLSAEGAEVARVLPPNSVLISCIGNLGKTGINAIPVAFNQQINAIIFPTEIDPKFGFYYFQTSATKERMDELASATTVAIINKSKFSTIPFPIPPRPEQERIVAKIEELFTQLEAGVAELEQAKAQLQRYRQAVLKSAVEGELTREWREARGKGGSETRSNETGEELLTRILSECRTKWEAEELEKLRTKGKDPKNDKWKAKYKVPALPDIDGLPELPDGWVWASVEQLGAIGEQPVLTGPFGTNLGRKDFVDEGVTVLTIGCLTEKGIKLDKAVYITEEKARELSKYQLREGDLLFSRMASVGRAGYVKKSLDGVYFNYHIMRLRLDDRALLPRYYFAYVQGSSEVRDYIREVNHGATRDGINTKQLLGMPVAIPPIDEQSLINAKISRRLSVADEIEKELDQALARSERLRQSILKKAFEGQLV